MDRNEAERRMRRFSRRINGAMDELGVEPVLAALEATIDDLLDGGASRNRPGRPESVVLAGGGGDAEEDPVVAARHRLNESKRRAREAAKDRSRERRNESSAAGRGRPPRIVTKD